MSDSDSESKPFAVQSAETIREVRKYYREKIEFLGEHQEDLGNEKLTDVLEELNEALDAKVHRIQEFRLDARAVKLAAGIGADHAEKLRTNMNSFDVEDFVARLKRKLGTIEEDGEQVLDLAAAGEIAFGFGLRVPTIGFMLGPLAVVPKEKKQAPKRETKEKVEVIRPKEISTEDLAKKSTLETTELVKSIFRDLKRACSTSGSKAVDLIEFVTNPDPKRGFGQTVENLFYVAFLVRDDRVAWSFEDGMLMIEPLQNTLEEGYEVDPAQQSKQGARQLVVNLGWDDWKDAVELYHITTPMIRNRDAVPEATGQS